MYMVINSSDSIRSTSNKNDLLLQLYIIYMNLNYSFTGYHNQ